MMNSKSNRIALIPARLESTRLPEKLILPLGDLPVIVRTYQAVVRTGLFDKAVVVCNHSKIAAVLEEYNCEYIYDNTHFESGTDRIANVLAQFPYEIIVNVQGDEPFVEASHLQSVVDLFDNQKVEISTLKYEIGSKKEIDDPNNVKIVCNEERRALYFSRSVLPYNRDREKALPIYKHIGVYGYRRPVLQKLSQLKPSPLELAEKLENLRMIEHGFYVAVAEVSNAPFSIDTKEDYEEALVILTSDL